MPASWLFLAMALAACSGPDTKSHEFHPDLGSSLSTDLGHPDLAAGSRMDLAAHDLAAPPDLAGGSASGPQCPAEEGSTRQGAQWVYNESSNGLSGTTTTTLTSVTTSNGALALTATSQYLAGDAKGDSFSSSIVTQFRCDSTGYLLLSQRTDYSDVVSGTAITGWTTDTYSPPLRLMPANLQATTSWSSSGTIASQNSAGTGANTPYSYSYTVGGTSSLTVPAGTFTVITVAETTGTTTSMESYAAHVGFIADSIEQLKSYTP
jgi:hypothetical protein